MACPVCSFPETDEQEWSICRCCGTEMGPVGGSEDYLCNPYSEVRELWIKDGCQWWFSDGPPAGWEPEQQLIATGKDSKLYMQGFEDGKVLGYRIAHRTIEADRKVLAAHWKQD